MGDKSKIEWTDASWNPIRARNLETGRIGWHCEHATTGCINCYSEGFNKRLGTGLPFKPGHRADIEIFLDENMLTLPLRWKKPRMIFVCSMTDLFADFVKDEWIFAMFVVMAKCQQHTFQILTKRADRMRDYVSNNGLMSPGQFSWPLPNVWLGVSCERQEEANERIPHLLRTPAAIRFISAEPLVGPISLEHITSKEGFGSCLEPAEIHGVDLSHPFSKVGCCVGVIPALDWVIVGGESGPHARPMHSQWVRDLRDQCRAADVSFFFKQWGEFLPHDQGGGDIKHGITKKSYKVLDAWTWRIGKKAAGRLLDGVEHNGFPEAVRLTDAIVNITHCEDMTEESRRPVAARQSADVLVSLTSVLTCALAESAPDLTMALRNVDVLTARMKESLRERMGH